MSSSCCTSVIRSSPPSDLVEILKHSALEEAKEHESESEERAITILKLAEGLGMTAAGIEVFNLLEPEFYI